MSWFQDAFLWPQLLFSGKGRDQLKNDIKYGEGTAKVGNPLHGLTAGYKVHELMSPTVHINDRIHDIKKNGFGKDHLKWAIDDQNHNLQDAFKENIPALGAFIGGGAGGAFGGGGTAGGGLAGGASGAPAGGLGAAGIEGVTVVGSSGAGAGGGIGAGLGAAGSFMPGSPSGTPNGPLETVTVTAPGGGLSMTPGTEAAMAAAGASSAGSQGESWWDKLKDQMNQQGMGGQQQQQTSPAPQNSPPQQRGGLGVMDKISAGLFPVDSRAAEAIGPEALKQQRNQALMRMGLGMMAASNQGAGLGESLFTGLNSAQNSLDGALQRGYENAREARQEQRTLEREKVADQRYDAERQYQIDRDTIEDKRAEAQMAAQTEQRKLQLEQQRQQQEALAQYRKDTLAARQASANDDEPPTRVTDRGMFERQKDGTWKLVEGTEPTGVAGRPIPQGMANDLQTNASVMGQIDKALAQVRPGLGGGYDPEAQISSKASNALGGQNAVISALTPDSLSDNVKNWWDSEGTDLRATITNMNSYIVKERNGAAVTLAEFARQRGYLPTDSDPPETVEKKMLNLRKAVADEQQYIVDFAESQGYKAPPMNFRGGGASGGWSIRPKQ